MKYGPNIIYNKILLPSQLKVYTVTHDFQVLETTLHFGLTMQYYAQKQNHKIFKNPYYKP